MCQDNENNLSEQEHSVNSVRFLRLSNYISDKLSCSDRKKTTHKRQGSIGKSKERKQTNANN